VNKSGRQPIRERNQNMENYVLVFFILVIIVAIAGFIGNLIVVIVYVFDAKLNSPKTYFFVNLSTIDILIALLCLPVGLLDMYTDGRWALNERACQAFFFAENVFISVSSLTLISISIKRLHATLKPLEVKNNLSSYGDQEIYKAPRFLIWINLLFRLMSCPRKSQF
jgi:hypothetical protein